MENTESTNITVDLDLLAASLAKLAERLPRPTYLSVGKSARVCLSYESLCEASRAAVVLGVKLGKPYPRSDGGYQADTDATLGTGQAVNIIGVADAAEVAELDARAVAAAVLLS